MTIGVDDLAVQRLYAAYAARVDAGDYTGWGDLFTVGASFTARGITTIGRRSIVDMIRGDQVEGVRRSGMHFITNVLFERESVDAGVGSASFVFVGATSLYSATIEVIGTYLDHIERVDGEWLFARHEIDLLVDRPSA